MDIGLQMVFTGYGWDEISDQQVWDEELKIAEIAADSGFDCLWAVEHHFRDYAFCPDNLQLMAYLTAKHPEIDVGTAAVILPWQDPLRVAERRLRLTNSLMADCGLASGEAWRDVNSKVSVPPWPSLASALMKLPR